jgi:hypothetical protein
VSTCPTTAPPLPVPTIVSTSAAGSLTGARFGAAACADEGTNRVLKANAAIAVKDRRALWARREDNVVTGT